MGTGVWWSYRFLGRCPEVDGGTGVHGDAFARAFSGRMTEAVITDGTHTGG